MQLTEGWSIAWKSCAMTQWNRRRMRFEFCVLARARTARVANLLWPFSLPIQLASGGGRPTHPRWICSVLPCEIYLARDSADARAPDGAGSHQPIEATHSTWISEKREPICLHFGTWTSEQDWGTRVVDASGCARSEQHGYLRLSIPNCSMGDAAGRGAEAPTLRMGDRHLPGAPPARQIRNPVAHQTLPAE